MKMIRLLMLLLVINLCGLAYFATTAKADDPNPNLMCEDIVGCVGKAGCGEAGTVSNCLLTCDHGPVVSCLRQRPGDDDDDCEECVYE